MNMITNQALMKRLLKVNMAVAAFTLLANGSALLMGLSGKAPEVLSNLFEITLILFVAVTVVVTAAFAFAKSEYGQKALAYHAVAISTGAIAMVLWGLSLVIQPTEALNSSIKVNWSVGWLTALASYSAYLVTHTFFYRSYNSSLIVKYAYIWVGAIVLLIDIFVFLRIASTVLY